MGRSIIAVLVLMVVGDGCVRRELHVQTDPPGALIYMNDQEIGRTPVTRDFLWYGKYDIQIRKEGYETFRKRQMILAPWWQWPPFDLVAELMPFHPTDERTLSYTLQPASTEPADPMTMLFNAARMQADLESSEFTKKPGEAATTRPRQFKRKNAETTQPTVRPTSAIAP